MWFVMSIFAIAGGVPSMLYQAVQQSKTVEGGCAAKVPIGWHVPGWALGFLALAAFVAALIYPISGPASTSPASR